MKLKDIKICTQLHIGLGVILALAVMLAALMWEQTDRLWLQTKGLYDHPLMVSRAVGELKSDILNMSRLMIISCLAENEAERQAALQDIDTAEADAHREFEIVFDVYLGPRSDVDKAFQGFVQWKAIRAETSRLLQEGKTAEAISRIKGGGASDAHVEKLLGHTLIISDFSKTRGDKFYQGATRQNDSMKMQLAFMVGVSILLAAGIGYFLSIRIKGPLKELTVLTEEYRKGNLDARSRYVSDNEFGELAASFNRMAEAIPSRIDAEIKSAGMVQSLIVANEMTEFAGTVLDKIMDVTESNLGAFYLRNKDDGRFSPLVAVGVNPELLAPFDAAIFEGEFGKALKTQSVSHIRNIPEETVFQFKTFAGTAVPREIITLPVVVRGEVRAMISLACLSGYSETALNVLSPPVIITLNTAFANILANDETRLLAEALLASNQELQAQREELEAKEELRKQSEELQEQNVELEQQRLAVEEANRLKSGFLSNMSHELRTPLNSVMALSRVLMMQARTKLSEEEVTYLEIIERNGKNLLTLINEILDLAKIESGRMDIYPRPFSLGLAVDNMLESIMPLAGEKQIEIHQEIPEDLPSLESDEIRVSQILQNLLSNAVKFTDAGSVSVSVRSDLERVFVRISDTGIGIAENDLPYIFDEFRQADGSSARRHEGTGLGLAIARKAASMLGGEISVESVPGKGSVFTLSLPLVWPGPAPFHEPISIRPPSGVKSERKTILVVDDEPEMAAMISRYLLQEGYNTITATSGAEALKLAARDRPFAITLDIIMPDMDGWEVLQSLKKNPDTRDIPVIVVSVTEDRETGFALGAIGYITKPVSKDRLIAEIRRIGKPRARSILIVDDNDLDRREIRRIIDEEGFNSIVAEDGAACLALLEKQITDVLVLDLMMPEPDGFTVLERIRANPKTRDLPVVVTAKDLTPEDRKKLSGNVSSVLEKSAAATQTLLAEIKRILLKLEGPSQVPAARTSPAPPRILVVEDNPDNVTTIKAVLQNRYRILEATDGEEGLRMATEARPDLILLDMALPKMDGFAVARHLKEDKALSHIPVIALTARVMKGDREKILGAGCDDYIAKPIEPESFLKKIGGWLKK